MLNRSCEIFSILRAMPSPMHRPHRLKRLENDKVQRLVAESTLRSQSLLPTTTQSLIELDQGGEFVSLRLGQSQFSREIVGIVRQDFQVVRGPCFEAHFRQSSSILRSFRQMFPLCSELLVFAVCNECVGNVTKRSLY